MIKTSWLKWHYGSGANMKLPAGGISAFYDSMASHGANNLGYKIVVFGKQISNVYSSQEAAQQAAVRIARVVLQESLEQLPE